jgi:hypothetical protein
VWDPRRLAKKGGEFKTVEPIHTYVQAGPRVKQEEEWTEWGAVEKEEPPAKFMEGPWVKIPTIQELDTIKKIELDQYISNPYQKSLYEWNSTTESSNKFKNLIEQACLYYQATQKLDWKKAVLSLDEMFFWKDEMITLNHYSQLQVTKVVRSTEGLKKIEELQVKVRPLPSVSRKIEKMAEFLEGRVDESLIKKVKALEPPTKAEDPESFRGKVLFQVLNRIQLEELLKIVSRLLRHELKIHPSRNNPWHQVMNGVSNPRIVIKNGQLYDIVADIDFAQSISRSLPPPKIEEISDVERTYSEAPSRNEPEPPRQPIKKESEAIHSRRAAPGDPDDDPSDDSDDDRRKPSGPPRPPRPPRRPRTTAPTPGPARQPTPLGDNPHLFPGPPPIDPGQKDDVKNPILDNKFKVSDLPSWNGSNKTLVNWVFDCNSLGSLSRAVWNALGIHLPRKFEGTARLWWQSLTEERQREISTSWTTLRLAICTRWMTVEWIAQEKNRARAIHFRSEGHPNETPMNYFFRKLRALKVSFSYWDDLDLVQEILAHAPQQWQKYFTSRIETVEQLSDVIQAYQHLFQKEEEETSQLKWLTTQVKDLKDRRNHPSSSNFVKKPEHKFPFKAKANNATADKKKIGAHPSFENPKGPPLDHVISKGKTPKDKGVRACRHCGSFNHWDFDCPLHRKTKVHVHFVEADSSLLEAMQEYEEAYHESSAEEEENKDEDAHASDEDSGNESASD